MGVKRTEEEVTRLVSDAGYILLSDYYDKDDRKHRRISIQDTYGYKYDCLLESLLSNRRMWIVHKSNKYSLENLHLWLKLNKKSFYLISKNRYVDSKSKLNFYCNICTESFKSSWDSIRNKQGCPFCAGQKVGRFNNLGHLRQDLIKEWSNKNKISIYKIMPATTKTYFWKCKLCTYEWKTSPNNRTRINGSNCPNCVSSKGESLISYILDSLSVAYYKQRTFNDCKLDRKLPFDFYLPEYNLCIEYDGILHYKDKFNSPMEFKLIKKRDRLKTKFCKNNKINLLRIPYWNFNNIEEILKETLL